MAEGCKTLNDCFATADLHRKQIESSYDTNSERFQGELTTTIAIFEQCLTRADNVALFSINESLEDIASSDLKYLLLHYHIAGLVLRITVTNRLLNLQKARREYESFLKVLDNYDILSTSNQKTLEHYLEDPEGFSTASVSDAAARRQEKIAKFKEEKALKAKLQALENDPFALQNDDDILRKVHLLTLELKIQQTFQALETIAQESQILKMAPPSPPMEPTVPLQDQRHRERRTNNTYSDRLDISSSGSSSNGAILSKEGRPLRPFTLLDKRQRLQQGVFRPDHNLPTMTVDEYLEEEKRRGGIIKGGGEQSGIAPSIDEDNLDLADAETMKAREWDDYVEANPRGSGNTMNMG